MKPYRTTLNIDFYANSEEEARQVKELAIDSLKGLTIEAPAVIKGLKFAKNNSGLLSEIFTTI